MNTPFTDKKLSPKAELYGEHLKKCMSVFEPSGEYRFCALCGMNAESLDQAITEAQQETAREILLLVEKHDPSINRSTSPAYWGNTLRQDIQSRYLSRERETKNLEA